MTVFVSMSPQTIYMSGMDPHLDNMDIPVRVLDCDTITQVSSTIYLLGLDPHLDNMDIPVRVLDCDTITQVSSTIYLSGPRLTEAILVYPFFIFLNIQP
jgi:hypothetical protein